MWATWGHRPHNFLAVVAIAPMESAPMTENHLAWERKFLELSFPGAKVPWNESSWKVLRSESSIIRLFLLVVWSSFGQCNVIYIACQHRRMRRGERTPKNSWKKYFCGQLLRKIRARQLRILVRILYVVRFRTFALRILYVPRNDAFCQVTDRPI